MPDTARAISCLTYDEIDTCDPLTLLDRSVSHELRQIEKELGAKGKTRLFAIAEAIDEALLALIED